MKLFAATDGCPGPTFHHALRVAAARLKLATDLVEASGKMRLRYSTRLSFVAALCVWNHIVVIDLNVNKILLACILLLLTLIIYRVSQNCYSEFCKCYNNVWTPCDVYYFPTLGTALGLEIVWRLLFLLKAFANQMSIGSNGPLAALGLKFLWMTSLTSVALSMPVPLAFMSGLRPECLLLINPPDANLLLFM